MSMEDTSQYTPHSNIEEPLETVHPYAYPDPDAELQQPEQTTPSPFDDDEFAFAFNQYNDLKGLNLWFKLHGVIGFTLSLIVMLVWHWVRKKDEYHWWFIYPFSVFAFSLTIHHSIIKKTPWNIFYGFLWISNVTLVLTWASVTLGDQKDKPWPIFCIFPSLMIQYLVDFLRKSKSSQSIYRFILNECWILNAFLFTIWTFYGGRFPWFFIPLIVMATPVMMYRVYNIDGEKKKWPLIAVVVAMTSLLCFFIWIFTYQVIPWFPIPAIIGIPIVILVAKYEGKKKQQNVETTV